MAKSKENLSLVDDFCYLLSKKWFNSWKDYTGYEDLIKGTSPITIRLGPTEVQILREEKARSDKHRYHWQKR
jgi:hypothetical protein